MLDLRSLRRGFVTAARLTRLGRIIRPARLTRPTRLTRITRLNWLTRLARPALRNLPLRRAPTRLGVRLDPSAEDLMHDMEPTAEQEVHRSVAAAKDVTRLGVDLF